MHPLISALSTQSVFTGVLADDVPAFLRAHDRPATAVHSAAVAAEAERLAKRYGVNSDQASSAGWLHDISGAIPGAARLEAAQQLGLEILPEEAQFPVILHQKLSVVLSHLLFGINDLDVLTAIGCHTTLRAQATPLDQVVFLADKLAWDQPGTPPYLHGLLEAMDRSLAEGAWYFVDYLWQRRATLTVVHPWLCAAHADLEIRFPPPPAVDAG